MQLFGYNVLSEIILVESYYNLNTFSIGVLSNAFFKISNIGLRATLF